MADGRLDREPPIGPTVQLSAGQTVRLLQIEAELQPDVLTFLTEELALSG